MNDQPQPGCAEFQQGRLLQYAYGELLPREMEIIRRHLESCADCRRAAEALARVRAAAGEAILRENPPPALEVKLRAAARDRKAGSSGLTEKILRLWQPRFLYAAAGVAALLVAVGVSWHIWSSRRLEPKDLDPASLVALGQEVDGWQAPPVAGAAPNLTPLEQMEQEMEEWTPNAPVEMDTWYQELNQTGLDEIEQGIRELDSGVRYL